MPNAKAKLWPLEVRWLVEWPFRENGAERIDTALVKVDFLPFEMCFKMIYRSKWTVSSNNMIE